MSSQEMENFIINPFTNRLIKRGSKTHKRLVSAKLLDEELVKLPKNNLVLEAKDTSEAKHILSKMSKGSLGKNKIITRRGNKVLKANRRPTRQETIDAVSNIAVDTVLESRDEILSQDMSDAEMDDYIKRLIQIRLIGGTTKPKTTKPTKSIPQRQEEEYDSDSDYSQ
jgi:hypothetical protein